MIQHLAIVGSRNFANEWLVRETVRRLAVKNPELTIVSRGAKGVDSWAENEAVKCNLKTLIFLPDWELYGRAAGFVRNQQIVDASDAVLAFWDGISKGTLNSLNKARKKNKNPRALDSQGNELTF